MILLKNNPYIMSKKIVINDPFKNYDILCNSEYIKECIESNSFYIKYILRYIYEHRGHFIFYLVLGTEFKTRSPVKLYSTFRHVCCLHNFRDLINKLITDLEEDESIYNAFENRSVIHISWIGIRVE